MPQYPLEKYPRGLCVRVKSESKPGVHRYGSGRINCGGMGHSLDLKKRGGAQMSSADAEQLGKYFT